MVTKQVKAYLQAIGRLGGKAKSERKTLAARLNARKPRPKARKNFVANGQ